MLSLGLQAEPGIEGGNTIDLFEGAAQSLCDHRLHLYGQIPIDILRLLHHGHQRAGLPLVIRNDLFERSFLLGRASERDRGLRTSHTHPPYTYCLGLSYNRNNSLF